MDAVVIFATLVGYVVVFIAGVVFGVLISKDRELEYRKKVEEIMVDTINSYERCMMYDGKAVAVMHWMLKEIKSIGIEGK